LAIESKIAFPLHLQSIAIYSLLQSTYCNLQFVSFWLWEGVPYLLAHFGSAHLSDDSSDDSEIIEVQLGLAILGSVIKESSLIFSELIYGE
jgi:hypothetical protein